MQMESPETINLSRMSNCMGIQGRIKENKQRKKQKYLAGAGLRPGGPGALNPLESQCLLSGTMTISQTTSLSAGQIGSPFWFGLVWSGGSTGCAQDLLLILLSFPVASGNPIKVQIQIDCMQSLHPYSVSLGPGSTPYC